MTKHSLALWALLAGVIGVSAQVSTQLGTTTIFPNLVVENNLQAGTLTSTGTEKLTGTAPQISLGVNGGNGGQVTLNGATSGTSTLTVSATAGHLAIAASSSPTITAGCTGTGSAVSGTDTDGLITGQNTASTTCTITFGTAYSAAPICTVTGLNSPLTGAVTIAAATLQVNFASTTNYKFTYHCFGN